MESRITSKGGSIADINAAMDGCDASNVSYSVVSNGMEATQEKAPYLGRTRSIGSCSQRDLASFMRTLGCETHEMEIMRIWDVSGAHVIKSLKEQPRMFDLGFVKIGPQLGGAPVVFMCGSWLLFEGMKSFLPPHSNILRFASEYTIAERYDTVDDLWRIFYREGCEAEPEALPEDTSMMRGYKKLLLNGDMPGGALGYKLYKAI